LIGEDQRGEAKKYVLKLRMKRENGEKDGQSNVDMMREGSKNAQDGRQ
jgi:hypothetical protein